jgi:transcriptional regulator
VLIHPWDAATDREWRDWLADGRQFGQLIAVDADANPIVVPTPFFFDGNDRILLHLARPNPIWPALEHRGVAMLTVIDDYAHVPGTWRTEPGQAPATGVPTEYYATVQLAGPVDLIDDPAAKADLLRQQLAAYDMAADHAEVGVDEPPYGRQLPGIRGVVLHIREVRAKFKYDDRKSVEIQRAVAGRLADRDRNHDNGARRQQLRRIDRRTDDFRPA